jgi:hypothetical protein
MEAMLMMLPRRWSRIERPKTCEGSSAPPTRFKSMTCCHASSGSVQKSAPGGNVASGRLPPAAFTSTVLGPHVRSIASRACSKLPGSCASAAWKIAVPPACSIACTRC